ncbi:hypothetical protein AHAT_25640 [Agarivorans sp. Toyoura001]|nr:hypothetical protein AHAT_25640 [Agarivorans sp. Toyoura001]
MVKTKLKNKNFKNVAVNFTLNRERMIMMDFMGWVALSYLQNKKTEEQRIAELSR